MKKTNTTSKITFLLLVFLFSSCKYRTYHPINFEFDLNSVTAIDLEEDGYWLSSMQDEIEIYYSLAGLDKNNKPVGPVERRHYSEIFYKRGQTEYGYSPLSVNIPAKGKVYFSIRLIENDDYSSISNTIDDLSTIVDIAKFVSNNKKKGSIAARSLRMASRSLTWLGIAVTIVDIIDTNDKLLGVCIVLDEDQLEALSERGSTSLSVRGKGSNWGDRYHYKVNFALLAKQALGEQIRERVKTKRKAPNIYVNFTPFIIDQNLNDYWHKSPDRLLVKSETKKDQYDWSDGLYNNNFSVALGFGVSPAFKIKNFTVGKFYLQGTYRRLPYLLNQEKDLFLSNFYFQNDNGAPVEMSANNITLDIEQYRAAATFKILSEKVIWEVGGGMLYHKGRTKFRGVVLGNPNAKFVYDDTQNVIEGSYTPFAFSKFGFGKINKTKGFSINAGVMAFKPNFEVNNSYGISSSNVQFTPAPTLSDDFKFSYAFGLDFYF